ncbi:hypothetical protein VP01_191g13 [Puccinia sorghi]|uniref:Uncharacterized protein n=1 Tax=Puccinia sorghi TaxID=27349 RepID=A0A0L6VCQ6_9BASI|nr:hypothetical protein VP01_191g13 [Puccinia sorghi]
MKDLSKSLTVFPAAGLSKGSLVDKKGERPVFSGSPPSRSPSCKLVKPPTGDLVRFVLWLLCIALETRSISNYQASYLISITRKLLVFIKVKLYSPFNFLKKKKKSYRIHLMEASTFVRHSLKPMNRLSSATQRRVHVSLTHSRRSQRGQSIRRSQCQESHRPRCCINTCFYDLQSSLAYILKQDRLPSTISIPFVFGVLIVGPSKNASPLEIPPYISVYLELSVAKQLHTDPDGNFLHLVGKIIWSTERPEMEASNIAVHHGGQYIPLQISEVKDRAENIPKEALENYLQTIPEFSKQKSIVFTGLNQENSMKSDYIFIRDSLKILEKQAHEMQSTFEPKSDFNKLSKNIQDLKDFSKLLTQGTIERLYKLKYQQSLIKTMDISHLKQKGRAGTVQKTFKRSKKDVSASFLNSDVVERINKMVWDGQIKRLNTILHDLNSLKDNRVKFSAINILIKNLQSNIFQTVDYMYKQEMISAKALKEFFKFKNTLELAALNMYLTKGTERIPAFWYKVYRDRNPLSILNNWDCAYYRSLFCDIFILFQTVLDERDKRYFSYLSLKTFQLEFKSSRNTLYDFLFQDDHLFHTLEESFSLFSKTSLSKTKKPLNHGEIQPYSEIRNRGRDLTRITEDLVEMFQNSLAETCRIAAFYILNFILINYGLDILGVKNVGQFQEKMNYISSRLQLIRELKNIKWYMAKKTSSELTLTDDMKSMGGEVVMIYKYYLLLLPQIEQILYNDEPMDFFLNIYLHTEKVYIEENIDRIMSVFSLMNLAEGHGLMLNHVNSSSIVTFSFGVQF